MTSFIEGAKLRWSYIIALVMALLTLSGCAQPMSGPPSAGEETKQIITIEARDQILRYQWQSFWTEEKFSQLSENDLKARFKEKYKVKAENFEVSFDKTKKSTILICDIEGAMYSANQYEFHWLLGDLPFDLFAFKQSEKELTYEGKVNDVPTTIRLIFPYAISHCHEHVWPK